MILADILLAFSIAGIFVIILLESTLGARDIFEYSRERSAMLDIYNAHADEFGDLAPHQSKEITVQSGSSTIPIHAMARWYGNERVETSVTIDGKFTIEHIRPYETENKKMIGVPLCSVDLVSAKSDTGESDALKNISISQIILPIDPLVPLTDIEVRNNIAYISTDSSRASDADLFVFDIASSTNPTLLYSLNTGPGIASISVVTNHIFAAAVSTTAQLHVIRINSPDSLVLENKYTLELPSTSTPPTVGSHVSYYNGYIFLGTTKWDGSELNVFKISELSSLEYVAGLEIGSKVTGILPIRDRLYITASAEDQLILVDVIDPANPIILDTFSPSGWSRQEGKTVSFFEDRVTFGRTSGGFDIKADHELFHGTSPSPLDVVEFPDSINMSGGIYGIVGNRSYIFVASREADKEIQIFDPQNISNGPLEVYSLPVAPQTMVCDNDRLFVLAVSAPVIYEIFFK